MTPKQLGYSFPPEWAKHEATWLTFPTNTDTWEGDKLEKVYPSYLDFIKIIAEAEKVQVIVPSDEFAQWVISEIRQRNGNDKQVICHVRPSNDAWCRDHGPAFLLNPHAEDKKILIDWEYNAWGGKYPPFDADNQLPSYIAEYLNLKSFRPEIVMEGGSVEFNGKGTVLTSRSCLLNPNRNPHLNQTQIEQYLADYYGIEQVLWVSDGIVGDDTDGHIDDTVRFINEDTVVAVQ
jgi:agmatine deiminase